MRLTPSGISVLAALLTGSFACTDDVAITTGTVPLATGAFYDLHWGGTQIERFFALARSMDSHEMMVISPEHKEPCSLGDDVAGTWVMQPQTQAKYVIGSPSPTRIGLFSPIGDDGSQTLSFADIHCQRLDLQVQGARIGHYWNLYSPDYTELKLVTLSDDNVLTLADPWQGEQRVLARGVSSSRWFQTEIWAIDGGELVRYGHDGNEISRRGRGITAFSRLGDKDDFAYSSDKGTFVERNGKTKQVGPAGSCNPTPIDAFLPGAVAFYSPCDSDRLAVAQDATGKHYEYESGVYLYLDQPGALLFTTRSDAKTKLWRVDSAMPGKPVLLRETEKFASLVQYVQVNPSLVIMIVQLEPNTPWQVWSFNPTEEDPTTPVLVLHDGLVGINPLDEGTFVAFSNGDAVVYDPTFTQEVFRVWSSPQGPAPMPVFRGKATAIAYLSDLDPETKLGRLQLHLLNGTHFELDQDVRQFQEVWWPERGIVYIKGGDKPGVNFARVDIPCETTSDTAWACGF